VAAIWGSTFVLVKDAVALFPTLPFLALRFALATAVLALPAWLRWRRLRNYSRESPEPAGGATEPSPHLAGRRVLRGGLLMGFFLAAGYVFQTLGLDRTSASNAGFITGLFVVLTPLLEAFFFRRWIGSAAAAGVVLAFTGLFLLSGGAAVVQGNAGSRLAGDFLVLLCALSFALHILVTARYAGNEDPIVLTAVQLGVVALLCGLLTAGSWLLEIGPPPAWPREQEVLLALGITAIFASALGFYAQTYAQAYSPATRTAVILTMEPVFAGLFAYAFAGERLGLTGWLGAGLILAGMLVSELLPGERRHWVSVEEGTSWVSEDGD
jgi:drug/metabolite transporter (DMT)-like permease